MRPSSTSSSMTRSVLTKTGRSASGARPGQAVSRLAQKRILPARFPEGPLLNTRPGVIKLPKSCDKKFSLRQFVKRTLPRPQRHGQSSSKRILPILCICGPIRSRCPWLGPKANFWGPTSTRLRPCRASEGQLPPSPLPWIGMHHRRRADRLKPPADKAAARRTLLSERNYSRPCQSPAYVLKRLTSLLDRSGLCWSCCRHLLSHFLFQSKSEI